MWPKQIIQGQNEANRKHLCFVSMVQQYYPTDEIINSNSIKLNENFLGSERESHKIWGL